jgi:hypothetical protein
MAKAAVQAVSKTHPPWPDNLSHQPDRGIENTQQRRYKQPVLLHERFAIIQSRKPRLTRRSSVHLSVES